MRTLLASVFVALALALPAQAEEVDSVYDFCPNLDWAYSPLDAYQKSGDLYEMKFSNRDGVYICVKSHP